MLTPKPIRTLAVLHVVPKVKYPGTICDLSKAFATFSTCTAVPCLPFSILEPTVVAPVAPPSEPITLEIVHDAGCLPCAFALPLLVQGTQFTHSPSSKLPFGNCCAPAVPATASSASVKSCFFIVSFCVKRGLHQAQGLHWHGTAPLLLLFCC